MDKLDLIIRDREAELRELQAELAEALTGIESPDYKKAARIQSLIYGVQEEIERLEELRHVALPPQDFSVFVSRLLTDDTKRTLEVWVTIKNYLNNVTVRLLEIRKAKSGYRLTCTLKLSEPLKAHFDLKHMTADLVHLGWTAGRGGRTFWLKAQVKNPDQFDAFNQGMAVTMLEAIPSLWRRGPQYFRYR